MYFMLLEFANLIIFDFTRNNLYYYYAPLFIINWVISLHKE